MAHSADIVGYTYKADIHCPTCIVSVVLGHGFAGGSDVEERLDGIARARGIDRGDERTFDGDEFPKVVFRDMARGIGQGDTDPNYWETGGDDYADRCGTCHEVLGE